MVATDVGDNSFIIGKTGRLLPPGDPEALTTVLEAMILLGSEGRRELGEWARQRVVENFSLENVVKEYESFCMNCVAAQLARSSTSQSRLIKLWVLPFCRCSALS